MKKEPKFDGDKKNANTFFKFIKDYPIIIIVWLALFSIGMIYVKSLDPEYEKVISKKNDDNDLVNYNTLKIERNISSM